MYYIFVCWLAVLFYGISNISGHLMPNQVILTETLFWFGLVWFGFMAYQSL